MSRRINRRRQVVRLFCVLDKETPRQFGESAAPSLAIRRTTQLASEHPHKSHPDPAIGATSLPYRTGIGVSTLYLTVSRGRRATDRRCADGELTDARCDASPYGRYADHELAYGCLGQRS